MSRFTPSGVKRGGEKNKHIFSRPSFVMACYAYSVLTRWFSSVYGGAGSETPLDKELKQLAVPSLRSRSQFALDPVCSGDPGSQKERSIPLRS